MKYLDAYTLYARIIMYNVYIFPVRLYKRFQSFKITESYHVHYVHKTVQSYITYSATRLNRGQPCTSCTYDAPHTICSVYKLLFLFLKCPDIPVTTYYSVFYEIRSQIVGRLVPSIYILSNRANQYLSESLSVYTHSSNAGRSGALL